MCVCSKYCSQKYICGESVYVFTWCGVTYRQQKYIFLLSLCVCVYKNYVHVLVIVAQLLRPGIGRNASCPLGDY